MSRRLLTYAEAAEMLNVSVKTVKRRVEDDTLEGRRIGASRRVTLESVERLLAGVVGEEAGRRFEPLEVAGDPVAAVASSIGLSPRVAVLRPELTERFEVLGAGEHLAQFASTYCRYIELGEVGEDGPSLGDPYELVEHEREFFDEALACDSAGRRVYGRAGLVIPRKNRKTTTVAVLSLYAASPADGEHRPRIVQAAGSKGQAAKLYETTSGFVSDPAYGSPLLQELFVPLETRIDCPSIAGRIHRVAGDGDLNHSLDPHVVAADELHTWKTPKQRENWKALTTAQGGRRDPLVIFLSTEGQGEDNELAAVLARLEESATTETEKRRPGLVVYRNRVAGVLVFKFAAPTDTAITDVESILLANPAPWRTRRRLEADLADELNDDATKLRLYGNVRSSSSQRWISADRWADAKDPEAPIRHTAADPVPDGWIEPDGVITVATDAAINRDTTAVAWAQKLPDGRVKVRAHVWSVRAEVPHHTFVTGGRLDNEDFAEPFISQRLAREFRVSLVGYDPRYFETEAKHLSEAGLSVTAVEPSSTNMAAAIAGFWKALLEGKIRHDGDPVLAAHVANTGGRQVPRGPDLAWKVFSLNRAKPKDALIAVVIAHHLTTLDAPKRRSWRPL